MLVQTVKKYQSFCKFPKSDAIYAKRVSNSPRCPNTGVATERIKSGMMLAVDGNAGTVTLLDEVPSGAQESADSQNLADSQGQTDKKSAKTRLALMMGIMMALIWWWKRPK